MVSVATADRATFLRERYARSIRVAVRLFTRQWLYAAYLVAGVGTLILCIAPSALAEAITFCIYVTSLTAFVYFDRRRFGRALADYENVQAEAGPDPDPEATRAMPRHMLTVDDAIDLPMLDAILVLGGDSLDEHNRVTKPLQKNFRAYTAAYFWLFLVYLCAFVAFVALVADHPAAQRHLGELAIALLASVPARAAVQDMNTYMQFAQRYVLARVDSAEKALKTLASREHPFVDGRAVRYRRGKYIVDRKATNPRVDGRSIDRHRRTSRQFGAGVWLGIGVALSVLVFIVHPISGNTGFVTGSDDDEALTWAGGRDPSHYETPEAKPVKPVKPVKVAKPTRTERADADLDDEDSDGEDDAPPSTSGAVLVSLGILGGIYLLYTVGWFVSWQRFVYVASTPLDQIAFSIQQGLSLVAAPVWFVVTLLLTRDRKPTVRLLWLLIGALALVPWPFTLGV